MPTLDWIGKQKVINHHQDVPYRVLDRRYSCNECGQREENNGSENMIIHGDNLAALKSLLPLYEGRIKCVYIEIKTQSLIQFNGRTPEMSLAVSLPFCGGYSLKCLDT